MKRKKHVETGSNNTNKLSPQEQAQTLQSSGSVQIIQINLVLKNLIDGWLCQSGSSNNTNKLSPQEHTTLLSFNLIGSNNTNKLSPQELAK